MPATTDCWVNDRTGDPLLVITGDLNAALTRAFPRLLRGGARRGRRAPGDDRGTGIWSHIGAVQQADAERLIHQALDAGIAFIDTADVYAGGLSEGLFGRVGGCAWSKPPSFSAGTIPVAPT